MNEASKPEMWVYQGSTFTNAANWLNSNYHDLVQEIGKPLAEKDTIYQSYIQANGNIGSSGNFSTTVGVYDVEEGKKYHVQYVTGNEYTRPYAFYDTNDSVLSDDNTFPEIPSGSDNGISVNTVIVTPSKATTLKITYNNTVSVVIVECTERFLRKVELSGIENKINEINKTISGDSGLSETIEFTATYQQKELSFTIPKGSVIHLSGDVNQITCRTNSADETYQTVTNGTVADRDINYVKSGATFGTATVGYEVEGLKGLADEVEGLKNTIGYSESLLSVRETLTQSYIMADGNIKESGTPTTTVDSYEIEDGILKVSYKTGNKYTKPYCFYNSSGGVVSDNNEFPEITTDGILVSNIELVVPEGATILKITYDNTIEHSVSKVSKNFISKTEFSALSEKVDSLEQSINSAKEGSGIAYRVSSKFRLRPLKILGVGNSWTNNATVYLGQILSGLGIKVEINVSYAGGATLQSYWNNIKNNTAAYEFRKWREGQGWIEPDANSTYKDILLADDWDILTHQQQSGNGGNYPSFQPYLHDIINWEKSLVKVMPLFFMHATWAYPNGYDNEQFETLYGSDTTTMYNAILDAYNQAMVDENIDNVMPSVPMIQQVRTLGIPDIDTADGGSHLSTNGQFAAACVWAEMLLRNYFDQSVTSDLSILNSTYKPSALSDENAMTIRKLAKEIVENVRTYFPMQKL